MKHFLLITMLAIGVIASKHTLAQDKKDCKFTTVKLTNGNKLEMVKVSAKLGYFLIGKADGNMSLNYNTNLFFNTFAPSSNTISIKIDSVKFMFEDNSFLVLKTVYGIGHVVNNSTVLKPIIRSANFAINYLPGSKEDQIFRQKKVKVFMVIAEKEAQYGEALNEKPQQQFINAFSCIPE